MNSNIFENVKGDENSITHLFLSILYHSRKITKKVIGLFSLPGVEFHTDSILNFYFQHETLNGFKNTKGCIPDGRIDIDDNIIIIESKIDAPLIVEQLEKELELINENAKEKGWLVVITKSHKDKTIVENLNQKGDKKIKWISWHDIDKEVFKVFEMYDDQKTKFLAKQTNLFFIKRGLAMDKVKWVFSEGCKARGNMINVIEEALEKISEEEGYEKGNTTTGGEYYSAYVKHERLNIGFTIKDFEELPLNVQLFDSDFLNKYGKELKKQGYVKRENNWVEKPIDLDNEKFFCENYEGQVQFLVNKIKEELSNLKKFC